MTARIRCPRVALVLLLCGIPVAQGGGTYLVQGIGLERVLEIGAAPPPNAQKERNGWFSAANLDFRTTSGNLDGKVVLIRCRDPNCLTDRGVRIGDSWADVLRRYGAPLDSSVANGKALIRYRGIGFLVREVKVSAIFVLPP